jgi:hypothetical protein
VKLNVNGVDVFWHFVEKWIESVEKFKNGLPWGLKKNEGIYKVSSLWKKMKLVLIWL